MKGVTEQTDWTWLGETQFEWGKLTFHPGGLVTATTTAQAWIAAAPICGDRPPLAAPLDAAELREQAADLLEQVADYIDRVGWTQHAYQNTAGEVCSLGGMTRVSAQVAVRAEAERLLAEYLIANDDYLRAVAKCWTQEGSPRSGEFIMTYNDMEGRTKEDVLHAFRKAAITARESAS